MSELIETTCNLIDKKIAEMDIPQQGEPVRFCFLKSQFESARETFGQDDKFKEGVVLIYLKSGENIIINMSYDDLLSKLKQ